ncbi:MAG: peptidylprolyl isomerase [Phycisphaerales bacterium]
MKLFTIPALSIALMASMAFAQTSTDNQTTSEDTDINLSPENYAAVTFQTNRGEIVLLLDKANAPISVENFLTYVKDGHYDGTVFHRVIPNFMIQGGGFDENYAQKETRDPIKNEWLNGLKNIRGSISMARLGNQPDSATSQFFINVVDNAVLDTARDGAAYAVFGTVVEGMDAVDAIRNTPTGMGKLDGRPAQDVPQELQVIESASVTALSDLSDTAMQNAAEWKSRVDEWRSAAEAAEKARQEAMEQELNEAKELLKGMDVNVDDLTTTDSGLMYIDAVVGDGEQPASTNATVSVHYTGWLTTGSKFDSSRDRGQPASFPLNRVIPGWTEGVSSMKVGGKRYLIIPSDLGYGPRGAGGVIPPNAMLVFEVELLSTQGG